MTTGKPSDRAVTADLMARLQRHYIKPGAPLPGGVFLPEVGWNGVGNTSRADALYVGFTGTSGRLLVGHEVKASRADWLNELRKPGKADAWADQCQEWWLVTPEGIILPGELPEGWGHMVPGPGRTRMRVKVPAHRHPGRTPSWDAMRSIVARQDTLRAEAIARARARAREEEQTERADAIAKGVAAATRTPDAEATVQIREENAQLLAMFGLERAYGKELSFHVKNESGTLRYQRITPEFVSTVVAIVQDASTLADARSKLQDRYALRYLEDMGEAIAVALATHKQLAQEIKEQNL